MAPASLSAYPPAAGLLPPPRLGAGVRVRVRPRARSGGGGARADAADVCAPGAGRRGALAMQAALAAAVVLPLPKRAMATAAWDERQRAVDLPLRWDGSSYIVRFWLRSGADQPWAPFNAVLDSGSPFLTVLRQTQRNCESFGCFAGEGEASGLAPTYEQYGLQRDEVTDWLLGDVAFDTAAVDGPPAWTVPQVVFAASSSVVAASGTGGASPLFGLIRDRVEDIRPTLLEQTGVDAFAITLSESPSRDTEGANLRLFRGETTLRTHYQNNESMLRRTYALPLHDLRPLGAPVRHHAFEVHRLTVNGRAVNVDMPGRRKIFAVVDTGTTGLLVSRGLYEEAGFDKGFVSCSVEVLASDAGALHPPEAAATNAKEEAEGAPTEDGASYDQLVSWRQAKVAERGAELAALRSASAGRPRTAPTMPAPAPGAEGTTILTLESDVRRCRLPDCLLLASPIDVPWWDEGTYDVMFLGLAFLTQDWETIGVDLNESVMLLTRRLGV